MELSKKKISKIMKQKNQSRKKMNKKSNRKKKNYKKSFRKGKPFNLRNKTLKHKIKLRGKQTCMEPGRSQMVQYRQEILKSM